MAPTAGGVGNYKDLFSTLNGTENYKVHQEHFMKLGLAYIVKDYIYSDKQSFNTMLMGKEHNVG